MAESIADLQIQLRASADKIASDISRDIDSQKAAIQTKAVALGGVIAAGITAGLAGVASAIRSAVSLGFQGLDRIDALDEAAGKIGATYNGLQNLKFAAESTGGSFEGMVSALGKMEGNLASGKIDEALGMLKLDAEALMKLAPEQQFAEISDKLSQMKSTADKIDLTRQIFGKGGVDILNVINGGKAGLEQVNALVEKLGGHLTDAQRTMVNMANDNIDALKAGWGFVKDQIAVGIAPVLTAITKELVQQAEGVGGIGKLVQGWVDGVVNFSASLATAAQFLDVIRSGFVAVGSVIGAQVALMQTGFKAGFELAKAGLQETEAGFKKLGAVIADSIISGFNTAKNGALKVLNDLEIEADVLALNLSKALHPDLAGSFDAVIKDRRGTRANFDPTKAVPDLPTGDTPGSPSSLLFPDGPETVDLTAANAALDDFSVAAIAAQDAIGSAADETGKKMAAIYDGKFWGDDIRARVAAEQEASRLAVASAQAAEVKTLEVQRAAGEEKIKVAKAVADRVKKVNDSAADQIQRANQRTVEQFRAMNRDGVTDIVTAWATGTGKISDIVAQWANNMIKQFIAISLFGNKMNGGSIGGLFGGASGTGGWAAAAGSIIGGFFADGGRPPMGKVSVVGERGPELFVPDSAGRIIPNNRAANFAGGGAAAGGGSESPVIIHVVQNFSNGVTRAELAGVMDEIEDQTRAGVLDAVRRGGAYRKGVQS